ncbi:MAG: HPP family protein [Porticoccaceae bacterium]|nr:HPP family protein [Porticoccaceae bacterium]
MTYFKKWQGRAGTAPQPPAVSELAFIGLGALLASGLLSGLAFYTKQPLILGSFGASIFILMLVPALPFAQPRNLIGGHLLATTVGLACFHFLGSEWWLMAVAVASAVMLMPLLGVSHPPAGSNPIIVYMVAPDWSFLFMPVATGAFGLLLFSLVYNNLSAKRSYPQYW